MRFLVYMSGFYDSIILLATCTFRKVILRPSMVYSGLSALGC